MHSIYSFWKDIVSKKDAFNHLSALTDFPFDLTSFSYVRKGRGFPDFTIKTNKDRSLFTGGEFIKLKSRNSYSIAPFKSAIPSGKVNTNTLLRNSIASDFQRQMQKVGGDLNLLQDRDVYFLIRGRQGNHQKICLMHGSFFETMEEKELIRQSFIQPLEEKLSGTPDFVQTGEYLKTFALDGKKLNRAPDIENASVKFRFAVIAEVKPEGNILNSKRYPDIRDDTINLIVPFHSEEERADIASKVEFVGGQRGMKQIKVFSIKHPLNGWFVVFQVNL